MLALWLAQLERKQVCHFGLDCDFFALIVIPIGLEPPKVFEGMSFSLSPKVRFFWAHKYCHEDPLCYVRGM